MGSLIVWLVGWLLKKKLTPEQHNEIVVHILDSLHAMPLTDIIIASEAGLFVQGKEVGIEQGSILRNAAMQMTRNKAWSLIREQVVYESFVGSSVKAVKPEDLLFYRAALWWGQQEEKYLRLLIGENQPEVERD